jgi:hypothetical protein
LFVAARGVGVGVAQAAGGWSTVDTASVSDRHGYGTYASVSYFTPYEGWSRGARVRVRAPRGNVELDMNSDCNNNERSVTRSFRSTGAWRLVSLPRGSGDCMYSVYADAAPGTLRLRLEVR